MNLHVNGKLHIRKIKWLKLGNLIWHVTDLREEWFETLEREYGIETDVGEARDRTDIPQEFWSDEWWKKREL